MPRLIFAVIALGLAAAPVWAAPSLYVTSTGDSTITKFANGSNNSGDISTFADSTKGLNGPRGLAFDSAGNLFVVNKGDATITKYAYDSSAGMLSSNGTRFDVGSNGMNNPYGLAIDPANHVFVAQYGNNGFDSTITEYASNGSLLATIGDAGYPVGLAFDKNGVLFVANQGGNITKFTYNSGTAMFAATTVASLTQPNGLAFDATGNLFVTGYNNKITKFTYNSGTGAFDGGVQFSSITGLNRPYGLTFDSAGDLFVANTGTSSNHGTTIMEYANSGGTLNPVGTTFASGLNQPSFLAFSPSVIAGAPEPSEWAALGFTAFGVGGLLLRARKRRIAA